MPLFVVVDSTGAQRRVATIPLPPDVDETLIEIPDLDEEPSSQEYVWDVDELRYVSRAQTDDSRYIFSRGDWMSSRVGLANEVALRAARMNESAPIQLRAIIETLEAELSRREFVDVRHQSTQLAAHQLAAILVQIGAMSDNEQTAFAESLLEPRT